MKPKKENRSDVVKIVFDDVNEVVILAAVVVDEKARKKYMSLTTDYFHGPAHAEMWAALQDLFGRGLEYSPDTLRSIVGDQFDVDKLDGYVKLYPVPPANLKHHIDMLRWDKARYEVSKGVLPLLVDALRDNKTDPERVMSLAAQVGKAFRGSSDLRYLRGSKAVGAELSVELTARREGRAVYRSGFDALDFWTEDHPEWGRSEEGEPFIKKGDPRIVPGFAPGQISVLSGISGAGKTTFTANLILKQVEMGRKVLWAAWEQTSVFSLDKIAAISLGFKLSDVKTGRFSSGDQKEIEREAERLDGSLYFFELPFGRRREEKTDHFNDRNLDLIHQYVAESNCDVGIFDVFNYALEDRRPASEDSAIRRMGAIAKDTKTHVMNVHHLNLKELEGRNDKRPTRNVVMGSSGWINSNDLVLAAHWPGMFGGEEDRFEMHFLKQRDGRWGFAVALKYNAHYGYIDAKAGETYVVDPEAAAEAEDFLDQKPRERGGYRKKNR